MCKINIAIWSLQDGAVAAIIRRFLENVKGGQTRKGSAAYHDIVVCMGVPYSPVHASEKRAVLQRS